MQKVSWLSALVVVFCCAFTVSCNSEKPAPAAPPPEPTPVADRIPQRAAVKLSGDNPMYGFDEWPNIPQALAEGEGRELTEAVCSACHSTAYIIGQPPLEEATWKAEVTKMVEAYGASIPEGGIEKITAYLTAHYGPGRKGSSGPSAPGASSAIDEATLARGEAVYRNRCLVCHQAQGQGVPHAFPPLAGHVPELLATDKGRAYLPQLVLYGLQGEIVVKGIKYNNVMTPFNMLPDKDLALALNYVATAWGNDQALVNFKPFTAEDIAEQRSRGGSSEKTRAARP